MILQNQIIKTRYVPDDDDEECESGEDLDGESEEE